MIDLRPCSNRHPYNLPRRVLMNSPFQLGLIKFSNFRILKWWESPKVLEMSTGLVKFNCILLLFNDSIITYLRPTFVYNAKFHCKFIMVIMVTHDRAHIIF